MKDYLEELPFSDENELVRYMRGTPLCVLFSSRAVQFECAGQTNKYISIFPEILMAINALITLGFVIETSDFMFLMGLVTSVVGVVLFFVPRKPIIGYMLLCFTLFMAIWTKGVALWMVFFTTMLLSAIGIMCWFLVLKNLAGHWIADNLSEFWDLWELGKVAISYEGKVYMHEGHEVKETKLKEIDQRFVEQFGTSSNPYTKKKILSAQDYLESFLSQKEKEKIKFDHQLSLDELDKRYADVFGHLKNRNTGEYISSAEGYLEAYKALKSGNSSATSSISSYSETLSKSELTDLQIKEYAAYICANSGLSKPTQEDAEDFVRYVLLVAEHGDRERALRNFNSFSNHLKKKGASRWLVEISFFAGLLEANGIITKKEVEAMDESFMEELKTDVMNQKSKQGE